MSDYTPEPWSVYEGEHIHGVLDAEGKHLAEMWQRKQYNSLANARRIVACINACEDISTETLESVKLADVGDMHDALRECVALLDESLGYVTTNWIRNRVDYVAQIEDAITNARKALGES